ncbi:MAG: hypothetical protein HPZ91_14465 [Lentisphaeria bacterium]|nr:hypothetical protein [Lentisphaeria bacterium]
MKLRLLSAVLFSGVLCIASEDPFPAFSELPENTVFPRNAEITVGPEGNYLVGGRARHFLGTQVATHMLAGDFAPTPGYPSALKWLYEEPLSFENAQRIGFDTLALFISPQPWLRKYNPDYRRGGWGEADRSFFDAMTANRLPLMIDYTCFPWSFGALAENQLFSGRIPAEAVNAYRKSGVNHWVPYNIFHPEGRKLYLDYWAQGVKDTAGLSGKRLIFELFNEPGYDDPSAYNRERFAVFLKERYGTAEEMNRVWGSSYACFEEAAAFRKQNENPGLFTDWGKFMESGMTALARDGAALIRREAPGALAAFQILGRSCYRSLPASNINYYEICRYMDAVSTPTTGGLTPRTSMEAPPAHTVETPSDPACAEGILMRHFIRSVAGKRPIHNPEAYARTDRQENRNVLWQDLLRGSDITYLYMWSKRAWDWQPRGSAEGGRRIAERFSYQLANPYGFTADALAGFMDARQEIARFSDFFVPRGRQMPREVAILLSFPTERRAVPTGYTLRNEVLNYAAGLEFTHYPIDAFVEEQLPVKRPCRAIVAVGIRNTLPGTLRKLQTFVEEGGILIAARETMPEDEYGYPLASPLFAGVEYRDFPDAPQQELFFTGLARTPLLPGRIMARNTRRITAAPGWKTLATVDSVPAVLSRPFGKGHLYLITPQLQDYAAGAVAKSILERHGIHPALELARFPEGDLAVNIEAHAVRHDGLQLAHLLNLDPYAKQLQVTLPEGCGEAAELLSGELLPVMGGKARLLLGVNSYAILGFGSRQALTERFGPLTEVSAGTLETRQRKIEAERLAELRQRRGEGFRFHPDPANTVPVELRSFANSGFTDEVAGDGKGGWTDQGAENCLTGTPWEVTPLLGVPCDFIRFDENNDRSCIILASKSMRRKLPEKVEGIPVNARARAIYFFHSAGYCRRGMKVMSYRIRYADGTQLELPVFAGEEIADWWLSAAGTLKNRIAWRNSADRGFYLHEWRNPEPEKAVASVDLLSANGPAIPIVIGITVERVPDSMRELSAAGATLRAWGNALAVKEGDSAVIRVTEKTAGWAGFSFRFPTPLPLDDDALKQAALTFEINGGEDPFGNFRGGQKLQVYLAANHKAVGAKYRLPQPDGDAGSFEVVAIPLNRLINELPPGGVDAVTFQFLGGGNESGVTVKNLRINWPKR